MSKSRNDVVTQVGDIIKITLHSSKKHGIIRKGHASTQYIEIHDIVIGSKGLQIIISMEDATFTDYSVGMEVDAILLSNGKLRIFN